MQLMKWGYCLQGKLWTVTKWERSLDNGTFPCLNKFSYMTDGIYVEEPRGV